MPTRTDDVVLGILRGVQHVVTHSGISQYQAGGLSACGLAALNCARVILTKEKEGLSGEALLNELVQEEMARVSFLPSTLFLISDFSEFVGDHFDLCSVVEQCSS